MFLLNVQKEEGLAKSPVKTTPPPTSSSAFWAPHLLGGMEFRMGGVAKRNGLGSRARGVSISMLCSCVALGKLPNLSELSLLTR